MRTGSYPPDSNEYEKMITLIFSLIELCPEGLVTTGTLALHHINIFFFTKKDKEHKIYKER